MKKSHRHDQLSDVACRAPGCRKRIKQRLIEAKNSIYLCYNHYCKKERLRGHTINTNARQKRIEQNLPVKVFV